MLAMSPPARFPLPELLSDSVRCTVPEEVARLVDDAKDALSEEAARLRSVTAMSQPSRYHEGALLGAGGMGVVASVTDSLLGREVAMKTLDTRASGRAAVLRFLEEAQITGQLDHPGVVPVHDFGLSASDDRAYFTMKLVRGESLSMLIAAHQRFGLAGRPLEKLLGAFCRVCEAVAFAHTRGVVHCDLKPDNILIGSYGQVYVMDWGLALVLEGGRPSDRIVEGRSVAGTPAFMAPEQARGDNHELGPQTDVYGLGAVLFAILTGCGPHHAETNAAALESARRGLVDESRLESAPPELARITLRALAPRAEDRYASVEELGHDVEEFLRGGGWFRTRTYEAGEVILEEGEPGSVAYVLASGRCEVFKRVDGEKVALRILESGDVFGETAVFTAKPRSATVVALTPCTVKIVTRDALERELERNPWMGAFVRAVAERFREADEKLTSLRPPSSG
jgi:eukaryotic-like serine/threonine-protein kinase